MTTELYDVVITGELLKGVDITMAARSLAATFKLTPERAQQLLQAAPKVIKTNVDDITAQKYRQTLQDLGIQVSLKPAENVPVAPISTVAPLNNAAPPLNNTAPQAPEQSESAVSDLHEAATSDQTEPAKPTAQASPKDFKGYAFSIEGGPDFAFLNVTIPANQTLKVEASAMATMDTHLEMKTKMRGGLARLLTSESIFVNEFTAANAVGHIGIAPASPGDLVHRYLNGENLFLQNSAFVACHPNITLETKWQGLVKGFFSGEALFLIRASGVGDLWFNSYGAIMEIDVQDGYVVDTGNIVAFTDGLEYSITKVGGYKSLFFSGEGFVCRFKGQGKVWIQTRSVGGFTSWADFYRPVKKG